jgi:hypothetical protein
VDNIEIDLGEMGWGDVDWICLAQNGYHWRAIANNLRKTLGSSRMAAQLVACPGVLSSIVNQQKFLL